VNPPLQTTIDAAKFPVLEGRVVSAHTAVGSPREKVMILLVEDSEDDAFFFQRELSKSGEGYECTHLENGAAAVEFLASLTRDEAPKPGSILMFLDLKMPVLSGFDVLAWIKQTGFAHPMHIVVLSGSDDPGDRVRARELGAAEYIVKPISTETLQNEIRAVRENTQKSERTTGTK